MNLQSTITSIRPSKLIKIKEPTHLNRLFYFIELLSNTYPEVNHITYILHRKHRMLLDLLS